MKYLEIIADNLSNADWSWGCVSWIPAGEQSSLLISDPILDPALVSKCKIEEVFELDAISHELQRQRMKIGIFYQFHDGVREGDVQADS